MAGLVPAIPIRKSAVLDMVGITGTRPVTTWRVSRIDSVIPGRTQ
jgi:hypothetical protein